MRKLLVCLVAALPLGACAMHSERRVETGYVPGTLAVAAIDGGDLALAERLLAKSPLDRDDPARLINLGYVYHQQGRRQEALDAWRAALAAPRHKMVATMSGREVRTDELAREILVRHQRSFASAR